MLQDTYYSDKSTDDSFRDVRNSIALQPGIQAEATKLFTVNKLLFVWLLDQLSAFGPIEVLRGSDRWRPPSPRIPASPGHPKCPSGHTNVIVDKYVRNMYYCFDCRARFH